MADKYLEEQNNKNNSFIINVNKLVHNLPTVIEVNEKITDTLIEEILTVRDKTEQSAELARRWAENPYMSEVVKDGFSSLHWATDSKLSADKSASKVQEIENLVIDSTEQVQAHINNAIETLEEKSASTINEINEKTESAITNIDNVSNNIAEYINNTVNSALEELEDISDAVKGDTSDIINSINAVSQEARLNLVNEGSKQLNLIIAEGDKQADSLSEETLRAREEADRADRAANRAEAVTGVGIATRTSLGLVQIGSGISVTTEGVISVDPENTVSTPVITFPGIVGIGYNYTAKFSSSTGSPSANIDRFVITINNGEPTNVQAVNNQGTLLITPVGENGSVGRLTVTAIDTKGNVSNIAVFTYIKNTVTINAPAILSPISGATQQLLTPTISVETASISGVSDNPDKTNIQIAKDSNFTNIVAEYNGNYNTVYTAPTLSLSTDYYIRARHSFQTYGWSTWGITSIFTTLGASIDTPKILSPVTGQVGISLKPTINISNFSNTGPVDTPIGTRIQMAKDSGFTNIVNEYNGSYVTSYTFSNNLEANTTYYVRAQHRGSLWGTSSWSTTIFFTSVDISLTVPTIIAPVNGITNTASVNLVCSIQEPVVLNQTITTVRFQVSTDSSFTNNIDSLDIPFTTNWVIPTLALNTKYYVRARLQGSVTGFTAWSNVTTFTTKSAGISNPVITSPINDATNFKLSGGIVQLEQPTVTDQTVSQMQIQLSVDPTFNTIDIDSGTIAFNTSWNIPSTLNINTKYYVRARISGSLTGWTPYTTARPFTTINVTISNPVITSPVNGATGIALTGSIITLQSPTVLNQTVSQMQIQVSTTSTFETTVMDSGVISFSTSWIMPTTLSLATVYYVRARISGSITGWTNYSLTNSFTSLSATISSPVITSPATGITNYPVSGNITLQQPTVNNQTLTAMQIQIATDSDFNDIVKDTGAVTFTQSYTITPALDLNTKYYIRARIQGSVTGWTTWSSVITVTTINPYLTLPSTILKTTTTSPSGPITMNAVTAVGQTISGMRIELLIDGNTVHDSGTVPYTTSYSFSAVTQLSLNGTKTMTVRFYYQGSITGWTSVKSESVTIQGLGSGQQEIVTTSGTYTLKNAGKYEFTLVGGGGKGGGGNGGYRQYDIYGQSYSNIPGSPGGGGGGGGGKIYSVTVNSNTSFTTSIGAGSNAGGIAGKNASYSPDSPSESGTPGGGGGETSVNILSNIFTAGGGGGGMPGYGGGGGGSSGKGVDGYRDAGKGGGTDGGAGGKAGSYFGKAGVNSTGGGGTINNTSSGNIFSAGKSTLAPEGTSYGYGGIGGSGGSGSTNPTSSTNGNNGCVVIKYLGV